MNHLEELIDIITASTWRMGALRLVSDLNLDDWWVAAGFVRNAVWDKLHGRPMTPLNDLDVIYYDPENTKIAFDENIRAELESRSPRKKWSVTNQARMHEQYGDAPYGSCLEAMRRWPETATAVALSLDSRGKLVVAAPYGLDDLFDLIVRPTRSELTMIVKERAEKKRWKKIWSSLTFVDIPE